AALVEQAAAAAMSLQEQAEDLFQLVAKFELGDDKTVVGRAGVERRGPNRAKNVTRPSPREDLQPAMPAAQLR
ncbi:MAG TPA: methyl-accepting chemotaxis protein, partial [Steroidobacteraceae bacterium]|nr:methyl-accepting chemotaxis protein [Steroidobacteraceae bacterium]